MKLYKLLLTMVVVIGLVQASDSYNNCGENFKPIGPQPLKKKSKLPKKLEIEALLEQQKKAASKKESDQAS